MSELGRTRWEAAHDLDGCPRLWFCALRLELKAANKGRFWRRQFFLACPKCSKCHRTRIVFVSDERRGAEWPGNRPRGRGGRGVEGGLDPSEAPSGGVEGASTPRPSEGRGVEGSSGANFFRGVLRYHGGQTPESGSKMTSDTCRRVS